MFGGVGLYHRGTFFGILAAARAPEKYHAYIAVAQMTNQLKSELLAYEYMLRRFRELGDVDTVGRRAQEILLHLSSSIGRSAPGR